MDKPQFAYVIEIAATPEKAWAALTSQEFWQQFSGPVDSDWKEGSPIKFLLPDGSLYSAGVVLKSEPPRLLSHTWPDPEGEQATERAQRLTWQIKSCGPTTARLTLIHENLTDKAYQGVSQGWPVILGGLKSSLEFVQAIQT